MGMIHMLTWVYLVNAYVTYDFFMDIWGFKKEEILSHYKVLEKLHGNGLTRKIASQIDVVLIKEDKQRGGVIQ